MSKPTHRAYIVEPACDGRDRKPRWIEIGVIWQHKNGQGFDGAAPSASSRW